MEDQQKINHFARLNNRLDELREDIKAKNNEIQTLKDASDDLMMLDDDEKVIVLKLRKDYDLNKRARRFLKTLETKKFVKCGTKLQKYFTI